MTEQEAIAIAQNWLHDWNQHNLDAILSHYADDVEFTSPLIAKLTRYENGIITDKAALREYFATGLAAYPDLKFEPLQILVGVNSIVIYYRSVQGLLAAECITINSQGLIAHSTAHYSSVV
jgi:hypothetical protein